MPKKKSRHMWTDQEKEMLIRDCQTLGGRIDPFCRKQGISPAWFRIMRKAYFHKHPELAAELNIQPPVKSAYPARAHPQTGFGALDDAAKSRLIHEYYQLPMHEKAAWRATHDVSQSMINYYRVRPPKLPIPVVALTQQPFTEADYHQYQSLPRGSKLPWLKERGWDHNMIDRFKLRHLSSNYNSNHSSPRTPDILTTPSGHTNSIDDAILAFEVERDQLNAFIEKLKRMRGPRTVKETFPR